MSLAKEITVDFLQVNNSAFMANATVGTLAVTGSAVLPAVTSDSITTKSLVVENADASSQATLSVVAGALNINAANIVLDGNVTVTGSLVTSNGLTTVITIVDNAAVTHTLTFTSGILTAYTAV